MITLYHSPHSRSTGILSLLRLMGKETEVTIKTVHIIRHGGLGQSDPKNPHPEGKVPLLEVNGRIIRERGAIMLWLTDHFDSPLGRGVDNPARGDYLSWLFYYGNVVEPILYLTYLEIAENAMIHAWCRDQATMFTALEAALAKHAFLVDDEFSAADLLVSAPFQWFPDLIPAQGRLREWFDQCMAAQDTAFIAEYDAQEMTQLGLPSLEEMYEDA
ncbi:glutathione S-transferase family protein [Loktanella sp. Alg231-35]|uniref:glutathione S-transferase family protein n=1 Tax=Loktanella sp. Alg231-35 TaxID=1922220 RepID=UPI000D550438|nr:glutathione S-transferase family protein [Loktanella sp. Alg231-35]